MDKVFIVTVSETFPAHESTLSLRCFSSSEKAERWIEEQIDGKVGAYDLDREKTVDGWQVLVDGWNHTIQYGFEELDVE